MSVAVQIAFLRARLVAKRSLTRAVDILLAAGFAFRDAVHFVLTFKRAAR